MASQCIICLEAGDEKLMKCLKCNCRKDPCDCSGHNCSSRIHFSCRNKYNSAMQKELICPCGSSFGVYEDPRNLPAICFTIVISIFVIIPNIAVYMFEQIASN